MPKRLSREERAVQLRLVDLLNAVERFANTLRRVLGLPDVTRSGASLLPALFPKAPILGPGESLQTIGSGGMVGAVRPRRRRRRARRAGKTRPDKRRRRAFPKHHGRD
jgi:hypothetical protein